MQNATPDSPRFRQRFAGLAFVGVALGLLAPASPASADDARAPGMRRLPALSLSEQAERSEVRSRRVWPVAIELRPGTAERLRPVGFAVRVGDGLSLGAAGSFDPVSGEAVGLLSVRFRF